MAVQEVYDYNPEAFKLNLLELLLKIIYSISLDVES